MGHETGREPWEIERSQWLQRVRELEQRERELLQQLRTQENLNSKILDALPMDIFMEDAEGRTIYANQATYKRNRLTEEELLGRTLYDFFPYEVAERFRRENLEVWRTGRLITSEGTSLVGGDEIYLYTGKTLICPDEQTGEKLLLGFALDITDRVLAEKSLRESEERFRKLVDQAADSFFLMDGSGQFLDVNRQACLSLGYTEEELLTMQAGQISSFPAGELLRLHERVVEEGTIQLEDEFRRKDGTRLPVDIRLGLVQVGDKQMVLALCRDMTERKKAAEKIEHMAYHDALTGLPNRWFVHKRVMECTAGKKGQVKPLAVVMFDLDHFKVINDSLGHKAGDRLLQQVAERLRRELAFADTIARLGGDEFLLLVPGVDTEEEALRAGRSVTELLKEPFELSGQKISVTASVGIALYPRDGGTMDSLVRSADIAMYRSKELGRNACRLFAPSMKDEAKERLRMEVLLREAIVEKQLVLHYQPKLDLRSGRVYGVEALVRWNSPEQGLVYPDAFISIAEETGLIVPMGEWIVREACRQCREWLDAGLGPLTVSVNLSARQFAKADLGRKIAAILGETGLPPNLLELELTESTVMGNPEEAARMLQSLKELGVCISIDDFGTGFSSLSYLTRFPIDTLKIDKSFISRLEEEQANGAIAAGIVSLAHSLHLKVVAEGVETQRQLDFLAAKGCDAVQGFHISRGLDPCALEAFLQQR
ncbi:sensor domain-containing protein [Paenibacillus caseinilyticus]|uniref:Diguanylate cyclase n=1 Tax=Paenibacillus mucilaginosus K02 TaxID=997761 RepID=I0BAX9_9BACL|nr:EAL domain-containing protein [Paenibacillus mucilaginosus]AFH59526.1 diguanylate cyclase [Paenibacillus mucilaginosus K02]